MAVWEKRWVAALSRLVALELPHEGELGAGGRLLTDCLGREQRWAVAFSVAIATSAAAALLLPGAVAVAIDAAAAGSVRPAPLITVGLVLTFLGAAEASAELAGTYYSANVAADLRDRLMRHTLRLGVPGSQRFATGELLSRLSVDTASPAMFLALVVGAVVTLALLVGSVVLLALIDWSLALAFVLGMPLALLVVRVLLSQTGELFLRYQQLQADIVTRLVDAVQGARTIRASGTTAREIDRILEPLPQLNATGRQSWAVQGRASWQLLLLIPMIEVLVLCVGGFGVAAGRITVGELIAAAGYVLLAVDSLEIVETLADGVHAHVGATRVATVLSTPPEVVAARAPVTMVDGPGLLEFRAVSVVMDSDVLLDHLDLAVPAGLCVAVVGRSGTGKSVLVSLVGRLLDPQQGQVHLDGVAVSAVALPALRHEVAYAFERPALLGDTIHDTIAYARPEASRAEVVRAAQTAAADHFIRLLPQAYDTPVAVARFSGGEVQRLGLARAMLADARVVVLDDATSSLDTATEVKIAQALAENLVGRTSLVVAHRATTAARADLVAWLDGGRIRALAPHELLWTDPDYRCIFAVEPDPSPVTVSVVSDT